MKSGFLFASTLACVLTVAACSGAKPKPAQQPPDFARGGRIFAVFCQQCHLNPDNEAPQLDDAEDWDVRTHEWTAVLQDHVKKGFLDMPAKGGHSGLSDQDIADVLYFMDVKLRAQQ